MDKITEIDQLKGDNEGRTISGPILHDQLRILFAHILPNTFGSVAIIIVYFWIFNSSFSTNLQYYWVTTILILFLARVLFYLRSLKIFLADKPKKWLYSYCVLIFSIGTVWGLMLFIPANIVEDDYTTIAIVTLLMGLSCISSISSAAHPLVIWSFLLPVGFLSSLFLLNSFSNGFGVVLTAGVLAFCGAAGFVGHTIHKMIVGALHLEAHNTSLMDEVVEIAKQNQKSYEGFQVLLDNLGAGAAMFDNNHRVISWNKSFENIFNLPTGLLKRGMSLREVVRKIIKQSWQNNIDVDQASEAHLKEILSDVDGNEMAKLVLADGRNLYSKVMKISGNQLVLNYTDVTSLEQARADDIIHVLQHDSLTGLPNQVLHKKEVSRRIAELKRKVTNKGGDNENQFIALIHFGLNSLNEIYEFLGLNAGDKVVAEVARRCKGYIGDDVHLAHVAYDEFRIITSREQNIEEVVKLAEELVDVIKAPIDISGNSITMTTSIGISTYPDHADKTDILNRNAKIAFNKAKLPKQENIVIYNSGMHSEIMQRTNMQFDIRDSIEKSEFLLNYQPQTDINSGDLIGVEALLRWQHPDKGWISPVDFIPLAEHTKQIIPLTEQFLPEACYQAKLWQDQGLPPIRMSVNISPFHFHERGFTKFIRNCFEGARLEPEFLDLEITEGVIMSQTEEIINILHELSEMGVKLSIDDFGTGYSSLAYLRSLPVDKLKIDQTFTKDMNNDASALSLVEAVIRLGHSFNLDVMAEGVETAEQLSKLKALNCDQVQGFLIKRPEKADDITKWIKENYT